MTRDNFIIFLIGGVLLACAYSTPIVDILEESVDGFSDSLTILGDGLENITDLTVDGIESVQREVNDFFQEQLEYRVQDAVDMNEAVVDVAEETVGGLRDTANAVEGYVDDSVKDTGRFTDTAVQSSIDGLVDAAESTGDMARNVADTFVRVWQDTGSAMETLAGNIVDNSVKLARDAGGVWRGVTRNAIKALTKWDPNERPERYYGRALLG